MQPEVQTVVSAQPHRGRMIAMGIMAGVLFLVAAVVTFLYASYQQVTVVPKTPSGVAAEPSPSLDPLRPYALVLLGYGGGNHEGGKLTDTIIVARVNPRAQQIHVISIPRDVWVSFPSSAEGETYWKVNAAYAIGSDPRRYGDRPSQYKGEAGGGELAKYAVSKIVGFPIDHFVAVNFAGFEKSITVLNGVNVKVEKTFDDYLYPIEGKEADTCGKTPEEMAASATFSAEQAEKEFPCRYEHLHFDAGRVHMDGATALKYVRSRHGAQDGSDFGRSARQRNLLVAVRDRIFEINFIPKAIPFIASLAGNMETDIPLSKIQEWLGQANEFKNYTMYNIALTDKNVFVQARSNNGQFIFQPGAGVDEWPAVHDYINSQISASATASAAIQDLP